MGLALKNVIQVDFEIGKVKGTSGADDLGRAFAIFKSTFSKIGANLLVTSHRSTNADVETPARELAQQMKRLILDESEMMRERIAEVDNDLSLYEFLGEDRKAEYSRQNIMAFQFELQEMEARMDEITAHMGFRLENSTKTSKGFVNEYKIGILDLQLDDEKIENHHIFDGIELAWDELGLNTAVQMTILSLDKFTELWEGKS